ncbi:hypothetical protein PAP_10170 [Palaeococcus pacificus DY20341]|uniref:4Fe4S-binding SPASM domain-containing protein n=1 Tax=Palaeococcus pacificus DY20341 TaxID=1343739 RepID=A0A075LUK6_9EURY|nr:SPASM domain-containing protein [Palaeococcus pacificus]AIF70405.1 hypothetical protein PAP_10170 [Palaeococcus pacificus DY20341]
MERTKIEPVMVDSTLVEGRFISIAKPPWTNREHNGKLERLIIQLGKGKGKYSEIDGIRRSIGCIGNNSFILRREPLSEERIKELIYEFSFTRGDELYLTNYDDVEMLVRVADYAGKLGIENVYMIVRIEDMEGISPIEGVKIIVEAEYNEENLKKLEKLSFIDGVLLIMTQEDYLEFMKHGTSFRTDIYLDIIYPPSLRSFKINSIELKRIRNPTANKYHPCLSGTLVISADGYALVCPLLRNFIIGDAKREGIKKLVRKTRLRNFWKLKKDKIEGCSLCPFKYICHDCRALEYQASGDPFGIEYCQLEI